MEFIGNIQQQSEKNLVWIPYDIDCRINKSYW
jgi:hypothetical protein